MCNRRRAHTINSVLYYIYNNKIDGALEKAARLSKKKNENLSLELSHTISTVRRYSIASRTLSQCLIHKSAYWLLPGQSFFKLTENGRVWNFERFNHIFVPLKRIMDSSMVEDYSMVQIHLSRCYKVFIDEEVSFGLLCKALQLKFTKWIMVKMCGLTTDSIKNDILPFQEFTSVFASLGFESLPIIPNSHTYLSMMNMRRAKLFIEQLIPTQFLSPVITLYLGKKNVSI